MSWSAPAPSAAWRTRCATTSRCCWSTRRATRAPTGHDRAVRRLPAGRPGRPGGRRRPAPRPGRCRCAGAGRDRRGRRRRWKGSARTVASGRARWWPPAGTPGWSARCWNRSARCRSWPGPGRDCRAGPARSTWSSYWPARRRTRAPRPRSPRRPGAVAACWWPRRRRPRSPDWPRERGTRSGCRRSPTTRSRPRSRYCRRCTSSTSVRRSRPPPSRTRWTRWRSACSPQLDVASNPAKDLALMLADALPLIWGGSVLSARAARRVVEAVRLASGRPALAADAEHLLPVLASQPPRDLFADPLHRGRAAAARAGHTGRRRGRAAGGGQPEAADGDRRAARRPGTRARARGRHGRRPATRR